MDKQLLQEEIRRLLGTGDTIFAFEIKNEICNCKKDNIVTEQYTKKS